MPIEISDLRELDPALVQQELSDAITRLQELHPELDLKRGVFHDTVAYYHAVLSASSRTNLNRYLSARSLQQISADPTLADEGVVDGILSNWRLERKIGNVAQGNVTVVLSDNVSVTISNGAEWSANGKTFITTSVISAKPEEALVSSNTDRLMVQLSDGNWAFTIPVEAVEAGPDSKLKKDTLILPSSQPTNFITAYAAEDFLDGEATETNDELLNRLQEGFAAKTISNRVNMRAMLREIEAFSRIQAMSIVGYGDAEMLRDQHSILPLSFGGRVDWYIRSQDRPQRKSLTKTATLVEKTSDNRGVWQFNIFKEDAPGFYEVRNIRLTGAENVVDGFDIVSDNRFVDLTDDGFLPDIESITEGAYSAFQASVVRFKDSATITTDLSVGDQASYEVEAVGFPLIREVQDTVSSRDVRSHGADALIKAPVPCFCQVNFTIYKQSSEPDPDQEGIKTAIMEVVNQTGFIGRLYASHLHDVIHAFLANSTSIGSIDLFGRIRRPDASTKYLRSYEVLQVPDEPELMVTPKTVQFILEPEDIGISIETSIPQPA